MNKQMVTLWLLPLLTVICGSLLAWFLLGTPGTGIDDADIFFVYARHFSDGYGFVYNIGGERVEGFTSLLWTLICAGWFSLFERIELPLYFLNVLLGMVTVGLCLRRTESRGIYLLLLVSLPAWFAWCQVTLMESGLWCLLVTAAILTILDRRSIHLSLLLPFLVITRPESMLWGAWLIIMLVVSVGTRAGWKVALRQALFPLAAFLVSIALLIQFRLCYFGYPVPNTYYAKVSSSLLNNLQHGTLYLLGYLFSSPFVFGSAAVWLWVMIRGLRRWRERPDDAFLLALCLLPGIGIPVLVGGDHFGSYRFYQPLWPLLCLLVVMMYNQIPRAMPSRWVCVVLPVLILLSWLLFPFMSRIRHEFRIAREGRETGVALEHMFRDLDRYPTVAVITAGGNKYGYSGTVLDLMGLNATEMAHAPGKRTGFKNHTAFNPDVFYSWSPDILLCGDSADFDTRVLKGLHDQPEFKGHYTKQQLLRNGHMVEAYYSKEFLDRIGEVKR